MELIAFLFHDLFAMLRHSKSIYQCLDPTINIAALIDLPRWLFTQEYDFEATMKGIGIPYERLKPCAVLVDCLA